MRLPARYPLQSIYICSMCWKPPAYRGMLSVTLLIFTCTVSLAQGKHLRGIIQDSHSDERIPFASVTFRNSSIGAVSDSAGNFSFHFSEWPSDTLIVTYVGYEDFKIGLDTRQDTIRLLVNLERGKRNTEVIVKSRIGRGLILWRKIVRNKPKNDRAKFDNYSYELYNKLEADINKVNKDRLGRIPGIRSFKFVFNNVDSVSEKDPFLPLYLTEAISNYYYQKNPLRRREVFKAVKTIGFENESVAKLLGGMDQNVNVYKNFIPVFDRDFISPISDNGSAYYNYRVPDTQYIGGRRFFHFVFNPKHRGENTFQGDAWIADSSFAVMKMNLRVSEGANLNFIEKLDLVQEYQLVNDSVWFLAKDKFVADFVLLGKKLGNFIGRKTTTYRNIVINDSSVLDQLNQNKVKEEVIMPQESKNQSDQYWSQARHEDLNRNEKNIYKMIDTLMGLPRFRRLTELVNFIGTGYRNVGNYQIGPWYNWISGNVYEGTRVRWDLGTNSGFSKKIYFATYLAYGFKDQKLKGKFETLYLFNRSPRSHIHFSYLNDIDHGQAYYDEVASDNIFAFALRKPGILYRYMKLKHEKVEYFKEWANGFSVTLNASHTRYDPVLNLPDKGKFPAENGGYSLDNFELGLRVRFAYLEKFLENTFSRISLGSDYPIVELRYSRGIPGVFKSSYRYGKLQGSISDYQKIPPFGSFYYNVYGGRVFGTLPYMLLELHPGNNYWYFNKYAFNLMTRYEYLSDRYAGINIEHNIGNGLFRLIPVTRLLKFRQFWNAKLMWADLSQANRDYNYVSDTTFKTLNGKAYMELGTGVDNILKVFRLDLVWRLFPRLPGDKRAERFGIFGSFRLVF